ncbi:hypothetical protein [Neobacillus drentensis]|uniref:hypothetical protein n=1 Tax=Neobacillus drentensis TaxID=220684 RepID=UPI002FFD9C73
MIKRIFLFQVLLLQFSGIIFAIVLEELSSEKMGVARYLTFKKQEFELGLFTPLNVQIFTFIMAAGAIICIALLIKKGRFMAILFAALINMVGLLFIQLKLELHAYHFFLIGLFIMIIVQYGWMIYFYYINKHRDKEYREKPNF